MSDNYSERTENTADILRGIVGGENVLLHEKMALHTSFKIGGEADLFVMPGSAEEICRCVRCCREEEIPFTVVGNGSNLLVSDSGFRGAVLQIGKRFSTVSADAGKKEIFAEAGARLSVIAQNALDEGLTGFEFASGIPGSLGGALTMNAGAYGGEMKDVVKSVKVLSADGEICEIPGEKMEFAYRTSLIQKKDLIALSAVISLEAGDREAISEKMKDLNGRRRAKQPLDLPSAGSTFRRPEGYFAGALIQEAGLMGFQIGGAAVSEKHAGFVVNRGGATAADVAALIAEIQRRVKENSGVDLQPEVRFLGDFS